MIRNHFLHCSCTVNKTMRNLSTEERQRGKLNILIQLQLLMMQLNLYQQPPSSPSITVNKTPQWPPLYNWPQNSVSTGGHCGEVRLYLIVFSHDACHFICVHVFKSEPLFFFFPVVHVLLDCEQSILFLPESVAPSFGRPECVEREKDSLFTVYYMYLQGSQWQPVTLT